MARLFTSTDIWNRLFSHLRRLLPGLIGCLRGLESVPANILTGFRRTEAANDVKFASCLVPQQVGGSTPAIFLNAFVPAPPEVHADALVRFALSGAVRKLKARP